MVIAALATSAVYADQEKGFAFGIGAASNRYDLNPSQAAGLSGSDRATGWEVFGSYRFNRYAAVEATYLDGGAVDIDYLTARIHLDGKAYGGSVVGSLPIGDSFAVFGRAGYMKGDLKLRATGPGGTASATDSDEAPIVGAGFRTMFDGAQIRLEYDRIDFDAMDVDRVSLSIAWLF